MRRALRHLTAILTVGLVCAGGLISTNPAIAAGHCTGGAISIVAHTDDDLLFQNPDILHDIQAGRCTQTVYTTAGEAGEDAEYWRGLEDGIRATYAQMAGVANSWTAASAGIPAGQIDVHTLTAAPHVSVVFLRLPDGMSGNGSAPYGFQSLEKLWQGQIASITTVDGRDWYTRTEMLSILLRLLADSGATTVRTLDWRSNPNLQDHSDHWATAVFTQLASRQYTAPHTLIAYEAYLIEGMPQNVTGDDLTKSVDAFVTFAEYDRFLCDTPGVGCPDPPHDAWLKRQYYVAVESTGNAARSTGTTVTASSSAGAAQSAAKARDGYPAGAPIAADLEWSTGQQGVGAWIQYDFASPTAIAGVTLFDRPNLNDQITSATLVFSDGSTVPVGALPNNGSGLTISFPARTVTAMRLDVTGVSGTTTAVGLAEFEAWQGPGGATEPDMTADPSHDFDGDGNPDVLARDSSGNLRLYSGNGAGGWLPSRVVGTGWNVMTAILMPGDFSGDGNADVLARDRNGRLILYPGNGAGGWQNAVQVGAGWGGMRTILGAGDFNSDGNADVLAVDSSYRMILYRGNGSGGWLGSVQVGSGWNGMTALVAPGDFSGDGNVDVLARASNGALFLYPGNGQGGWLPRSQVGSGWNVMTAIVGPGDFSGDGNVDVIARTSSGALVMYAGNGAGGWLSSAQVGSGWNIFNTIV